MNQLEKITNKFRKPIELAVDWLLYSKIHNLDFANSKIYGSFNDYYDLLKGTCHHAYTEITAYGIELFLDLYKRTNDLRYLENANIAGDWIISMQNLGKDRNAFGSFSWNFSLAKEQKSSRVYSFDAGICIGALIELYRKTGDYKFFEAASKGADWLISVMQNPDGSFKPFYDYKTKSFSNSEKRYSFLPRQIKVRTSWWERPGSYHCKSVIGLLKLHSISNDIRLEYAAKKLCQWTISQQDQTGFFRVHSQSRSVFTHTHCYATEGLTYASEYFGDKQLLSATMNAALWLVRLQKLYKRIPAWLHNGRPSFDNDSSSLAQTIRILSVLADLKSDKLHYSIITMLENLLKMQYTRTGDPDALGGFYLMETGSSLLKIRLPRLYSWPTMFSVHALLLLGDGKTSGFRLW